MVDPAGRRGICAGGVLLLAGVSQDTASRHPVGSSHLPEPVVGAAGIDLFPDDRVCQPGRSAPGDERALLDVAVLRNARRYRRSVVLPATGATGLEVPCVRYTCPERLSLLPAVQLPAYGELRQLLPHRASQRSVLHAVWARTGARSYAGEIETTGIRDQGLGNREQNWSTRTHLYTVSFQASPR